MRIRKLIFSLVAGWMSRREQVLGWFREARSSEQRYRGRGTSRGPWRAEAKKLEKLGELRCSFIGLETVSTLQFFLRHVSSRTSFAILWQYVARSNGNN